MSKNKKEPSKKDIYFTYSSNLDIKIIEHLSKLANLDLTVEEEHKYLSQLDDTLEYVKNMQELDTKNVTPTSHATKVENVYFEDGTPNTRGLDYEKKQYKVKRILSI